MAMVTISPWSFSFSARTMKTNQTLTVVGTNAHRVDAIEKVSGKAIYTSDIQLPGMAHARILRSPVAHARLVKVDASKAKEFPGVIATLTRDDIQGFNFKYGATYKDQSIVAVDKVRYVGDPVAAVLADTPDIAEQALELIEVEYDELPKVTNIEEATAPDAIQVHEGGVARAELRGSTYGAPDRFNGTNICYYLTFGREAVDKGFAQAEHIFEDTFRFQKVQHYSLEAHNNIASYDGEKLTVWASCQDPFTLRDHLSGIFGLPLSRIRDHRSLRRWRLWRQTLCQSRADFRSADMDDAPAGKAATLDQRKFQDRDPPPGEGHGENRRDQGWPINRARMPDLHGHWRLCGCRAAGDAESRLSVARARTIFHTPRLKLTAFIPTRFRRARFAALARSKLPGRTSRRWT